MSDKTDKTELHFCLESNCFPDKYCSAQYDSRKKSFCITRKDVPANSTKNTVTFTVIVHMDEDKRD